MFKSLKTDVNFARGIEDTRLSQCHKLESMHLLAATESPHDRLQNRLIINDLNNTVHAVTAAGVINGSIKQADNCTVDLRASVTERVTHSLADRP